MFGGILVDYCEPIPQRREYSPRSKISQQYSMEQLQLSIAVEVYEYHTRP